MARFSDRLRYGNPGRLVALGFLFFAFSADASRATALIGAPPASSSPSPAPSAVATPSPTPLPAAEAKKLLKEFQKAQKTQVQGIEHRQDLEIKEIKNSHKARIKEWESREKTLRHAFFKEHTKGPDRRTYVQDFIARRKTFRTGLSDERTAKNKEHDEQRKAIRVDHAAKLKEFGEILKRGERPPERLWPQAGS